MSRNEHFSFPFFENEMMTYLYDPLGSFPLTVIQLLNPKPLFHNLVRNRGCAVWTQEVGGYSLHSSRGLIRNEKTIELLIISINQENCCCHSPTSTST